MGAYLGSKYSNESHGNTDFSQNTPIHQAWLTNIQLNILEQPTLSSLTMEMMLPWFLYHHDNQQIRHTCLAQQNISTASTLGALYLLGDTLEWLMQCTPDIQNPQTLLYRHLQQQVFIYPQSIIADITPWIEQLGSPSLSLSPTEAIANTDSPMHVTLAIQQCLSYKENLALALNHSKKKLTSPTHSIIGYLLGAWGGMTVIPPQWVLTWKNQATAKQDISYIAQQLYRKWAGVMSISTTPFATFPLDL